MSRACLDIGMKPEQARALVQRLAGQGLVKVPQATPEAEIDRLLFAKRRQLKPKGDKGRSWAQ